MERLKVGILISGRGSNLQALIDACAEPDYPAEIVCVISNRADAMGLTRAAKARIPTEVVDHKSFAGRAEFDAALDRALIEHGATFACLAGFMRVLGPEFVETWRDRLVNIHPSLLPSFRGLNIHARVLEAGVRFTGCTVHFVRSEVDDGPTLVQAAVPVHANDTEETLAERVLAMEHRCYPLALRLIAEDRVWVQKGRVRISDPRAPETSLINPLDD